ncbi:hypothetical protein [Bacillus cereus]|uniref:hypothetical protein n=1 Tax=Bacillus cereus TaxID=1396 RepID=UPI00211D4C1B|nr:hypothetical protein [Bacillus cereus]
MYVTTKTNELNGFERIAKILEEVERSGTHQQMIEVLVEGKTYQSAFCFAHVVADIGQCVSLLLFTIIGRTYLSKIIREKRDGDCTLLL